MDNFYKKFFIAFVTVFVIDQMIKQFFLNGYDWNSKCISLNFTLNKGVAFSMFSFLGEWLKYNRWCAGVYLLAKREDA